MMDTIEIEVKFYLPDMNMMRNRIVELGADRRGRVFETNIRFDDVEKSLFQEGSLLRLRKDTKARLTFKSEPQIKDNQFKMFREMEVEVNDFSMMQKILAALGYQKEQVYEKWRETFVFNRAVLCLDAMPYGDFIEIEGSKEDIKEVSTRLGLPWRKRITLNYLAIFDIIREKLNLPFSDVTFDNFAGLGFGLTPFLRLIEAESH